MSILFPAHSLVKKIALVLSLLIVAVGSVSASADATIPPDKLINNLFSEVNQRIKADEQKIVADKKYLNVIGEEVLVPYVSFDTMAKQILGKNWRKITADQQNRYTSAFKDRVSSSIIAQYDPGKDYAMEITGFRTNDKGDQAAVSTELAETQSGKKYQISYKLYLDKKTKRWRVYDVAMDGVSVLQSFKTASAEDFRRNGIEYMIAQLTKEPEPATNTATTTSVEQ